MKKNKIVIIAVAINLVILAAGIWYYLSIPTRISIEFDSRNYSPGEIIVIEVKIENEHRIDEYLSR